MKRRHLENMSVEQLVAVFAEIGAAQDKVLLHEEIEEYNRLYKRKVEVLDELKFRKGDQRRALIPLLNHPNMQVRLNTAKATLAVTPTQARSTLEAIEASQHFPQAGDAGMSVRNLDLGVFKPT